MKKLFLSTLLVALGYFGANAQILYEDFEGGTSDLAWTAADGTYNGVVANPAPDAVNGSAFVGSYTKGAGFGYSLFWVQNVPALDLVQYNRFKLKVWCSVATPVLLKFQGPGQAVEKTVTMPAANQWVELTFDMSKGQGLTGLNTIIIFFDPGVDASSNTYYFDDLVAVKNENVIEDFEVPSGITWEHLNGVYNGAVANPAPNQVDASATVGSFTNGNGDYSFAVGTLPAALDLSVYNQFKVKMWAPKNTELLFKLEGGGNFKEIRKNIAVAKKWQEYTFDFSSVADVTTLNKITMVFSPGITNAPDTFYVDDIVAFPQGACAGATADPDIIDDFDCNRNAVYDNGWDSLTVVKNPAMGVDNPSLRVGRFGDPSGTGTEYAALVVDYENPIDLSTRNQFGLKLWAPKTGDLLLKIEGGSGPKEIHVPVTETNKWVSYSVDFSAQLGQGNDRLVMFFNAGVNGEPGDVYYIDDISLSAPKTKVLEDFQSALPNLGWQPLDQDDVLHGTFTFPSANPNPNSVNNSTQVACYSKGASPLSTLQGINVAGNFDLSKLPQFNIDVLSPASAAVGTVVRMILNSPTQSNKEVDAKIKTPGQWETLNFNFSQYNAITDFGEVRLIFNPNTAASGESWCIDNLTQSLETTDPCADAVPNSLIIEDYECQHNFVAAYGDISDVKVINNPHQTGDNPSLKVGEYTDPPNEPFAGFGFEFAQPFDLSVYNQLQMKVWSPNPNVPFLFKLEGGAAQGVEIWDTLTQANKWHTFNIDFSAYAGTPHNKLYLFFNAANDGGATYLVDDIKWGRQAYTGCILDFETPASTKNFIYFAQGPNFTEPFKVVDNPLKAGINTSDKVGKFVKPADGEEFTGMYTDLDAPVDFAGLKQMHAKVLMDHIGPFTFKVEQDKSGSNFGWTEIPVMNTKTGEWETLTADFSTAPDGAKYYRFTVFFDWQMVGNGVSDVISYFDDVVIGNGECGIVSTWHPLPVEPMIISPNPVSTTLKVENFKDVARLDVVNAYGQRVMSVNTNLDLKVDLDVASLPAGVYMLAGYNPNGLLLSNAKFIKQ